MVSFRLNFCLCSVGICLLFLCAIPTQGHLNNRICITFTMIHRDSINEPPSYLNWLQSACVIATEAQLYG
jgi:hypothetical protein